MQVDSRSVEFGSHLGTLNLSSSKSELNRALILQALYPSISISGHSSADDVRVMQRALSQQTGIIDCQQAGTALRFLTAYFASREGVLVDLKGSSRLQERPIAPLVEALRSMGASISYLEKEGFPPLQIQGNKLTNQVVQISAAQSSQFVTALLLIGASLPNGLDLTLEDEVVSAPYISMTVALLKSMGVIVQQQASRIQISALAAAQPQSIPLESDWSSASYFYAIIALSPPGTSIRLRTFFDKSRQGDAQVAQLFAQFGVSTTFEQNAILLKKESEVSQNPSQELQFHLLDQPDLAQTIAICCAGLGGNALLTGLQTLPFKETDRLVALQTELSKLGVAVQLTENSLRLQAPTSLKKDAKIATYQDHRMAMAFACLAVKTPISIDEPAVVQKSYPEFWSHLAQIGFNLQE